MARHLRARLAGVPLTLPSLAIAGPAHPRGLGRWEDRGQECQGLNGGGGEDRSCYRPFGLGDPRSAKQRAQAAKGTWLKGQGQLWKPGPRLRVLQSPRLTPACPPLSLGLHPAGETGALGRAHCEVCCDPGPVTLPEFSPPTGGHRAKCPATRAQASEDGCPGPGSPSLAGWPQKGWEDDPCRSGK